MTPAPERFNRTRVIVNGDFLPGQTLATKSSSVSQDVQGTWFIDARAFMTYLGGSVSYQDGATCLFLDGKSYAVPAAQARFNADKVLTVSADALRDLLKYEYCYDEALNALFFVTPK